MLILLLARKYARYLRWELLLWAFLLVIQAVFIASEMGSSSDGFVGRAMVHYVLDISVMIMAGVITVQLVQSDPVIGSTAFWMTRPISRAGLFVAKVLFGLLTVVGLPMIISGALTVALSAGGGAGTAVILTVFAWQLCVLAIAFFVASITISFARFLLIGAVLIVGFSGAVVYIGPPLRDLARRGWNPATLVDTQFWVLLVLTTALCLFVALYQHIRMNLRRTVGLTIVAAPLLLVTFSAWPWDLLAGPSISVDRRALNPASVAVSLDPETKIQPRRMFLGGRRERPIWRLFGDLTYGGLPQGVFLRPVRVESRLRFPNGPEIVTRGESQVRSMSKREALESQDLMLHALDDGQWTSLSAPHGRGLEPVLAEVPEAAYTEHAREAGTYSAVVALDAYRYRLWAESPLRTGASCALNPGRAVVREVARFGDAYRVELREVTVVNATSARSRIEGTYVLRNRARRQVFFPIALADSAARYPVFFSLGDQLRVLHTVLHVRLPAIDEAWLAEADLVRMEPVYLGQFTAPLRADKFVLPPGS
jgi:hypothetical protein